MIHQRDSQIIEAENSPDMWSTMKLACGQTTLIYRFPVHDEIEDEFTNYYQFGRTISVYMLLFEALSSEMWWK